MSSSEQGSSAFLLWAFVHLFYLVGWGNRMGTVSRWLWSLVARNRREPVIDVAMLHAGGRRRSDT